MSAEVISQTKRWNGHKFIVKRMFKNGETKEAFGMLFEIIYDDRTGKWHHFGVKGQEDSLCRERLNIPEKNCACIRACEEKIK